MTKESKYAIFEYEEQDENIINDLIDWLDKNAIMIFNFFDIALNNNKVKIQILKNKHEFDKDYKISNKLQKDYTVPDWCIGFSNNNQIKIVSFNDYANIPSHKNDTFELYKKTILHEYVHYVNFLFNQSKNCDYTEKYLVEGIACFLSKQYDGQKLELNSSIENILNENFASYSSYYLLTKYLVENYDKNFVLKLFQNKKQAREFLVTELYNKVKGQYAINQFSKNL